MTSSARPQSVRGLYTPPAEEWVFLPPSVSPPSTSSPSASAAPTHLPSSFNPNVEDEENLALPMMGRPFNLFLSEYLTTAMGMPFEVGKTLLQVEYRPRRKFVKEDELDIQSIEEKERFELQDDQISNPEEADMYFSDRLAQPAAPLLPPPELIAETDASGYLPDLHPSYLLNDDPEVSRGNGVWGMIRRIRYTPSEGLPGLWKSQILSTIHSFLSNLLQPTIHSCLLILIPNLEPGIGLDISLSALPNPGIPLTLQVSSHLISHLILSPLEIIKTRLIISPSNHSSNLNSISIFKQLIEKEGGFFNLYFHSNLLIPSILEHTLRPLLTLSIPLLIERQFNISPDISPITYSLMDLSLGLSSLLILLPIETVRKRLQLQNRGILTNGEKQKSIVKLREKNYIGVVEAIWRIVNEETGIRRKRKMTERDEGGWFSGVRQLYRGFGMAATAHVTVFGLGLVSQVLSGNDGGGWKEI
ncbi:uncharacterized protein I206_107274 [Kwoniella pini CBS 10737]|uniref:Mitochondrial fusion and transport protein ugo1 n=1 Tax=Kwoniella pini CBS 10737 TaxID=1296096 RepID=A0A1B9HYS5_9TREE|nr:uncharacterized protein I206_05181 [Kwoniella pini CBS 10737]OCF48404.1 hypothetical protein I206_05181 [Kwoniella pini CBS 10737]